MRVLIPLFLFSAIALGPAAEADAVAERRALSTTLARAESDADRIAAARALANFYWRAGLLPEANAAFAIASPDQPLADTRALLAHIARGLADETLETLAQGDVDALAPETDAAHIRAFFIAGRMVERGGTPPPEALLREAMRGYGHVPAWARARFTPALADAAARASAPSLAAHYTRLALRDAAPDAGAYAAGRAHEARRDAAAAQEAYAHAIAMAAPGRSPWAARAALRRTAIAWAAGDISPLTAATALERELSAWPDDAFAAEVLPAFGRAAFFAGHPQTAASAYIITIRRYSGTVHGAKADLAAERLANVLDAIIVKRRYPEVPLGARINLFAGARGLVPAPFGALPMDEAHMATLLDAELYEEVVRLTEDAPDVFAQQRAMAERALNPPPPAPLPAIDPRWPDREPRLAPQPRHAAAARLTLTALDAQRAPLDAALARAQRAGDLSGGDT